MNGKLLNALFANEVTGKFCMVFEAKSPSDLLPK
jgi:hypothetical protein